MPKISVGMFTYNRPETLQRAIDSILNQTFKDIELILVNNGSTISEVDKICKSAANNDSRVKLFSINPNSIRKAYEVILNNSTGEYYTQMDDDDYCDEYMLEFLYNLILEHNADISLCGSYRVINNVPVERYSSDEIIVMDKVQAVEELLKREKFGSEVWSKLFNIKKVIGNTGWTKYEKQGDADTVYKWFANADTVAAHGIPKYYQVRTKSESEELYGYIGKHNLTTELLNNYLEIYNKKTEYLINKVPEITERIIYSKWSFMISMYDKVHSYGLTGFDRQLSYMKKELTQDIDDFLHSPFIKDFEISNMEKYIINM